MSGYVRHLPEFVVRILKRADAWGSIAIMVIVAVAYFAMRSHALPPAELGVAIAIAGVLEGAFGVFQEERSQRSARENAVRLTARIGSMSANVPDPGPDRTSLSVHVFWEVWVKEDVNTDRIALNLIYEYDRHWWQPWRLARIPKTGIPRKGYDETEYRVPIRAADPQPYRDDAVFEYIADREKSVDPHWLLELVMVMGMPYEERRIPVALDWADLRTRGTNPPL